MFSFLKSAKFLKAAKFTGFVGVTAIGLGSYGYASERNLIPIKAQKPYWLAFEKWAEYRNMNTFTGHQFNQLYDGQILLKILALDMKHYNHVYQPGLNVDKVPFDPSGNCQRGGLYFSNSKNIHQFLNYGPFMGRVTIPSDAQVYCETDKCKADKFILSEIESKFRHRILTEHPESFNLNNFLWNASSSNYDHRANNDMIHLLKIGANPDEKEMHILLRHAMRDNNKEIAKVLFSRAGEAIEDLTPWERGQLSKMVLDQEPSETDEKSPKKN